MSSNSTQKYTPTLLTPKLIHIPYSCQRFSIFAMFPTSHMSFILFVLLVDYEDKALEKPLKLVLKVGGSEVTELSGSGHDSSYYDDRSDHERERHKEKKKKKKKKSEKDKDKYVDDEERRRRKVSFQKKILSYNAGGIFSNS